MHAVECAEAAAQLVMLKPPCHASDMPTHMAVLHSKTAVWSISLIGLRTFTGPRVLASLTCTTTQTCSMPVLQIGGCSNI